MKTTRPIQAMLDRVVDSIDKKALAKTMERQMTKPISGIVAISSIEEKWKINGSVFVIKKTTPTDSRDMADERYTVIESRKGLGSYQLTSDDMPENEYETAAGARYGLLCYLQRMKP